MVGPTAKLLRHTTSFVVLACRRPAGSHPAGSCLAEDDFRRRERLPPVTVWAGALARTGVATGTDVAGDPGSVLLR